MEKADFVSPPREDDYSTDSIIIMCLFVISGGNTNVNSNLGQKSCFVQQFPTTTALKPLTAVHPPSGLYICCLLK